MRDEWPHPELSGGFFNFRTGTYDVVGTQTPLTDERARQFIPQDEQTQDLYSVYRRVRTPDEALLAVLTAVTAVAPGGEATGGTDDAA